MAVGVIFTSLSFNTYAVFLLKLIDSLVQQPSHSDFIVRIVRYQFAQLVVTEVVDTRLFKGAVVVSDIVCRTALLLTTVLGRLDARFLTTSAQ